MFSKNFKQILDDKGITVEEISRDLNFDTLYVRKLLDDTLYPKSNDFTKIARVLGVPREKLGVIARPSEMIWHNLVKEPIPENLYNKPIFVTNSTNDKGKMIYVRFDGKGFYTSTIIDDKSRTEKQYIWDNAIRFWSSVEELYSE